VSEAGDSDAESLGDTSGKPAARDTASCVRLSPAELLGLKTLNSLPVHGTLLHGYHPHPLHLHRVHREGEFICDICGCSISQDILAERAMLMRLNTDDPDPYETTVTALTYLCIEPGCQVTAAGLAAGHVGKVGDYIFGLCYGCCRYDAGGRAFR
jgi:hypothetical protein